MERNDGIGWRIGRFDEQGRSNFEALQNALGGGVAVFYAFDFLYLDGHDITRMYQAERPTLLQIVLTDKEGFIRLSDEIKAYGEMLLKSACEHGFEGIFA